MLPKIIRQMSARNLLHEIYIFFSNAPVVLRLLLKRTREPHIQTRMMQDTAFVSGLYAFLWLYLLLSGCNVVIQDRTVLLSLALVMILCCILEVLSVSRFFLILLFIETIGLFTHMGTGIEAGTILLTQTVFCAAVLLGIFLFFFLPHLPPAILILGFTVLSGILYLATWAFGEKQNSSALSLLGFKTTEVVPRVLGVISLVRSCSLPARTEKDCYRIAIASIAVLGVHAAGLFLCNDIAPLFLLGLVYISIVFMTLRNKTLLVATMRCYIGVLAFLLPIFCLLRRTELFAVVYKKISLRLQVLSGNPAVDPMKEGYQSGAAIRAFYRCSFLGHTRLPALHAPNEFNDFFFVRIARVFGFCMLIVLMTAYILYLVLALLKTRHTVGFSSLLGCAGAMFIVYQAILNLSMCCNLFITAGVTAPFLSNGLFSLFTSSLQAGLLCASCCGIQPYSPIIVYHGKTFTTEEMF